MKRAGDKNETVALDVSEVVSLPDDYSEVRVRAQTSRADALAAPHACLSTSAALPVEDRPAVRQLDRQVEAV